jgi:hypothetical protein
MIRTSLPLILVPLVVVIFPRLAMRSFFFYAESDSITLFHGVFFDCSNQRKLKFSLEVLFRLDFDPDHCLETQKKKEKQKK